MQPAELTFGDGRILRLSTWKHDVMSDGTRHISGWLTAGEPLPVVIPRIVLKHADLPGREPVAGVRVGVDATSEGFVLVTWDPTDVEPPDPFADDPYGWEYGDWEDPQGHDCDGCDMCVRWEGRSYEDIRAARIKAVAHHRERAARNASTSRERKSG